MFKKVLVAEDFDAYNVAVRDALQMLDIPETAHVSYCDDALLKLKKSLQDEEPFDLLITDLSFTPDHRKVFLGSGQELIAAAKELQPSLKVLVYSVEKRTHSVKSLFDDLEVDGYVYKGRGNIPELSSAIAKIYDDERYLSPNVANILNDKSLDEIDETDLKLLRLLAQGMSQQEISDIFRKEGVSGNSQSSVEKRINRLKSMLRADNNVVQLIAVAKDLGLV